MFPSFFIQCYQINYTVTRLKLLRRQKYLTKAFHFSRQNAIINNLQKLFKKYIIPSEMVLAQTPQVLTKAKQSPKNC